MKTCLERGKGTDPATRSGVQVSLPLSLMCALHRSAVGWCTQTASPLSAFPGEGESSMLPRRSCTCGFSRFAIVNAEPGRFPTLPLE